MFPSGTRGTCIFISSSMSFLCRSPCAAAPPSSVTLRRLVRTRKACSSFHAGKMYASLFNKYIHTYIHIYICIFKYYIYIYHYHLCILIIYIYLHHLTFIIFDTYNLTFFSKCCMLFFWCFASKTLGETWNTTPL